MSVETSTQETDTHTVAASEETPLLPPASEANEVVRTGNVGSLTPIIILYSIHVCIQSRGNNWKYTSYGSNRHIGLYMSGLQSLISLITIKWWGCLSDAHGRKPVLLINIAGYILTSAFYLFIDHVGWTQWPVLLLMSVLQGSFGGYVVFYALVHAYIAESTAPEFRVSVLSAVYGSVVFFVGLTYCVCTLCTVGIWGTVDPSENGTPFKWSAAVLAFALFLTETSLPESMTLTEHISSVESCWSFSTLASRRNVLVSGLSLFFYSLTVPFVLVKIAYGIDSPGTPGIPYYWYYLFPPGVCCVGLLVGYPWISMLCQYKVGTAREVTTRLAIALAQLSLFVDAICSIVVVVVPRRLAILRLVFASLSFLPIGVNACLLALVSRSVGSRHYGSVFGMMAVIQDITITASVSHSEFRAC
ncbi:major facilitator superfamily domain-containing protein [Mucidula mucida]|nr:major facilitator superfamily domain-containing protein [Mucidula mucida]